MKEVSAGLHDSREGRDDDGGVVLPLARNLGVNGGVQKEGYQFSTAYVFGPRWTTPQRKTATSRLGN